MFDTIIDPKNIQEAYFELIEKFDQNIQSNRYCGIDGIHLNDIHMDSSKLLQQIKEELKEYTKISPALEVEIKGKKKDGSSRIVYIYTLKDRIKAQAIYRVVAPQVEEILSPYLFSYRTTHPSYKAIQSVAKRYKKFYGEDTLFCADISQYTESIDKEILKKKLAEVGFDSNTMKLLSLYIYNSLLSKGKIYEPSGLIQGVPLIALFANLYLNDIDHYVGKKVSLYRRVGDDFILFDKDQKKIESLKKYIMEEVVKLKLSIQEKKTRMIKSNEHFKFLGYDFSEKEIRIDPKTIRKVIMRWEKFLKYYPVKIDQKKRSLKKLLYSGSKAIYNEFIQIIATFRQATDKKQIQELSNTFFRILTVYFFGKYTSRNQRLLQSINLGKTPSLYKYYLDFHNGRTTLTSLSLSKKKHYQTRDRTSEI